MDKHKMALMNKRNVMNCIAEYGPINRAAIAKKVELSVPAIMEIAQELIQQGMVVSAKMPGKLSGKPLEQFSICGDHFRYVGVDVGRVTTRFALVGLDHGVLGKLKFPTIQVENESGFVDRICQGIHRVIDESGVDKATVAGVCVTMPGLIEHDTGWVIFSPNFGWKDIPLKQWIAQRLPYPVRVESANRAQVIYEISTHKGDQDRTVFCVGLGYGIGGGFYYKGQLYYGASGTSCEIGHMRVANHSDEPCSCGNTGCLEAEASGAALARKAQRAVREGRQTALRDMCEGDPDRITARWVFDAAEENDEFCRALIDQSARYIGSALATTINLLDPDKIYLCGGLLKNKGDFFQRILKYTVEMQMYQAGRKVEILTGSLDEWNVALGATRLFPYFGEDLND
ncbi:MAG: ROK family protein [Clostridia bacterium]|nr:ROK family protein [Clostridia bacterium]